MKSKFKNERGAIITLFIVISMLTFLVIVLASYRTVVRKEQGQVEATGQIREEYEKRTADDVYSEFIGGNTISIGSKEDFKIMLNVLNGLDDKGDELEDGKLSIQLSNGKWYTLTANSQYTLSNDLEGVDLFAFQQKYEELIESEPNFAFEFVGHTINKTVTGKTKNYNTTLTGGFYGPNNPVVPAGFMAVDLNSNSSWNSKGNIKNGLAIKDTLGNQFIWIPVVNIDDFAILEDETKISTKVKSINDIDKLDTISLKQVLWSFSQTGSEYEKVRNTANFISTVDTLDITEDFNQMVKSVCVYGGFYMSSYQIGNIEKYWPQDILIQSNINLYIPEIQSNRLVTSIFSSGYELNDATAGISFNHAKKIAKRMYNGEYDENEYLDNDMVTYENASESVKSDIIWGNQWDAVLSWMFEKTSEENENLGKEYVVNGEKYAYETISENRQERGFNNIYQMFYYEKDTANESDWIGMQYVQLFNEDGDGMYCYMRGDSEVPSGYSIDSETNEIYAYLDEAQSNKNSIRVTLTVNIPD